LYWLPGTAPNWRSSTSMPLRKPITGVAGLLRARRERPRGGRASERG
jgi:hypothetical protein